MRHHCLLASPEGVWLEPIVTDRELWECCEHKNRARRAIQETMSHSCVEIYLHVIFSTKGRLPLIPQNIENRLYGYIGGIARQQQVAILKINGTKDHLHILLKLHASVTVSTLLKELKSYSTGWMKKLGFADFGWQEGYGAFSCSISHLDALMQYIENQKAHHETQSFAQEIESLNKRWGVKWMHDIIESP